MQKENCPMKQELNYPIIDPCFELEDDKEGEIWTHKTIIETWIIIEKAEMKMETLIDILKIKMQMNIKKKIKMENITNTMSKKETRT